MNEQLTPLSLTNTVFYCCLLGKGEGFTSGFGLKAEISSMVWAVCEYFIKKIK